MAAALGNQLENLFQSKRNPSNKPMLSSIHCNFEAGDDLQWGKTVASGNIEKYKETKEADIWSYINLCRSGGKGGWGGYDDRAGE